MKTSSKNASFRPLRQLLLLENKKNAALGGRFCPSLGTKGTKKIGRYKVWYKFSGFDVNNVGKRAKGGGLKNHFTRKRVPKSATCDILGVL